MRNYNINLSHEFNNHIINSDGIYIIYLIFDNKLSLYINDNLIEDSISYNSLYYCTRLNINDIITIKNNDKYINLKNNNFKIFKL